MRLVVLGAAESGVGAAVLAQQKGYDVFVTDMGTIKPRYKEMLDAHGIVWEEGGQQDGGDPEAHGDFALVPCSVGPRAEDVATLGIEL